jgi:hypothetical protein
MVDASPPITRMPSGLVSSLPGQVE